MRQRLTREHVCEGNVKRKVVLAGFAQVTLLNHLCPNIIFSHFFGSSFGWCGSWIGHHLGPGATLQLFN